MHKNKILAFSGLFSFMMLGIAVVNTTKQNERNLKILPKDISDAKLDSIMHSYNKALGVTCNFCHAKPVVLAFGARDTLDYASDKEPMKENARDMMRMTIEMNAKYFHYDKNQKPEYLTTITCIMCHKGEPMPPGFH
ncbi:MAG: c-type cytochrome [Chitinophagaceae bacterium]|nr:c-type cytochrome [Chitinophagaceae bacterium]